MDKKLTLSLNQLVIEKAKKYAKSNGTSLSKLIEHYLRSLTTTAIDEKSLESTPLVDSLSGVVELPADYNYKESKAKHLAKKHK